MYGVIWPGYVKQNHLNVSVSECFFLSGVYMGLDPFGTGTKLI